MPIRRRLPPAAVIATLLLVLLLPSSASISSLVQQHELPAPTPAELSLVAELQPWATASAANGYRLFAGDEINPLASGALVTLARPGRGFGLFRSVDGSRQRQRLMATLPYGHLIQEAADQYRLDSLLLAAVVQAESGFDPRAVSPRGARGLMQLMPATAAHYGAVELTDPRTNVRVGARYLRELLVRFDDDVELALAAYNAGPANVLRYGGVPPFRETRGYVKRVLSAYRSLHDELWQESAATDAAVSAAQVAAR
jgi:hypothetical protein